MSRVKTWRAELAHQMVFGEGSAAGAREQGGEATGA
jgi:hypothetical protein